MDYQISFSSEDTDEGIEAGTFSARVTSVEGLLDCIRDVIKEEIDAEELKSLSISCKAKEEKEE